MPISKITNNSVSGLTATADAFSTASSNPSSPSDGDVYYNTTDNEVRFRANGQWRTQSSSLYVLPSALSWSGHNYTTGAHTGQDGLARSAGKITTPAVSYAGDNFTTAIRPSSDGNFVLVVRYLANGNPYIGLGISFAASISDAQASVDVGTSYYGLQNDWTGATGVTHYGGYFNASGTTPSLSQVGYVYYYTQGTGSSRTLYGNFSTTYNDAFTGHGDALNAGVDTPSNGNKIETSAWPITVGDNDIALAFGEASNTNEWRIERFGYY